MKILHVLWTKYRNRFFLRCSLSYLFFFNLFSPTFFFCNQPLQHETKCAQAARASIRLHSVPDIFLCAQVKSVNLSEGEQLSIRGADERGALLVLANHTLLVEGQVIRSPTNTLSVYYRSTLEGSMGDFQLHYQSECSRCTYEIMGEKKNIAKWIRYKQRNVNCRVHCVPNYYANYIFLWFS